MFLFSRLALLTAAAFAEPTQDKSISPTPTLATVRAPAVAGAVVKTVIGKKAGLAAGEHAVPVSRHLGRAQGPAPDLHLVHHSVKLAVGAVSGQGYL